MISTIASLIVSTSLNPGGHIQQTIDINATASTTPSNYIYTTTIDLAENRSVSQENDTATPIFPTYIRNTSIVFCTIIMCLGVIGNVMVPIVIFKSKDMRNSTNIFLVNLSVADLMVLLVCTPTVLVEVNSQPETWVLGQEMCKAVPFVEMTVAHASVLTILAISFERYYAICKPLKAGYVCTKARASLICLLAWFFAAVFTSPILAVAEYKYEIYFDGTLVPVCWTQADKFWPALFFILTVSIFFFVPLAILVILYTVIAKTLMEHPNIIAPPKTNLPPSQNALKYRKQVVLMLGTVVLAFFICLLPFKALTLWIVVVNDDSISNLGMEGYYILLYFCRIMFYLNSAVNPILYNVMSSKFRNGFLRLCGYKFKRKKRRNRTDSGRKTTNTSSTHTSSHNTSDSFWSRYSHRNSSAKKEQKELQLQQKKEKIDEICNIEGTTTATTVKNNNKNDGDIFMKMSRKNVNDRLGKIRSIKGESFV